MPIITSVNGAKKEINRIIHSVGGTKKDIGKIYHGANGTKQLVYESRSWDVNFNCTDISNNSYGGRIGPPFMGRTYTEFPEITVMPYAGGGGGNSPSTTTIITDFKLRKGDVLSHMFFKDWNSDEKSSTNCRDNSLTISFYNIVNNSDVLLGKFTHTIKAGEASSSTYGFTIVGYPNDFSVNNNGILKITIHNTVYGKYSADSYGLKMKVYINNKELH